MRLPLSIGLVLVLATLTSLRARFDPKDRFNLGFKPLELSRVNCKAELLLVGLGLGRGILVELLLKRGAMLAAVVVVAGAGVDAIVDPDLRLVPFLLEESTSSFLDTLAVTFVDGRAARLETLLTVAAALELVLTAAAALSPLCVLLLLLLATVPASLTFLAAETAPGFDAGTTRGILDCNFGNGRRPLVLSAPDVGLRSTLVGNLTQG